MGLWYSFLLRSNGFLSPEGSDVFIASLARVAKGIRSRHNAVVLAAVAALMAGPVVADDFGLPDTPLPGDAAPAPAAPAAPAAAEPAVPGVASPVQATQPPADPTAGAGTADEAFELKTKALEEQVNDLKEKIFRTKYRLSTLAESILEGGYNSGAKLAIWHRNELGSSYVLTSAAYTLDGAPLYTKVDESGELNDLEEFVIFDQRIVPGQHQMSVQYQLRGHGLKKGLQNPTRCRFGLARSGSQCIDQIALVH